MGLHCNHLLKLELCGGLAILEVVGVTERLRVGSLDPENASASPPTRPDRCKTVVTLMKKAFILAPKHSLLLRPGSM